MILFPPAKINLGLNVLNKREDGYHSIDSVMLPIPLFDVLEIIPADKFSFHASGLSISGEIDNNLCVKAYNLLCKEYQFPKVHILLHKEIPMGAGMGGGSADAAYVLSGLNKLFNLGISIQKLEYFASQLGSDCPFFIENIPKEVSGRGEILRSIELNLKDYWLVIMNPGIHISTKEAYENIQFNRSELLCREIVLADIRNWKNQLKNDFETYAFSKYPILDTLKERFYQQGAIYASMTGSGSTIYGLFEKEPKNIVEETGVFVRKLKL